jgi:hypothetical protein
VADLAKDPFSAMFFKPIEDTTPPVVDLAKDPSAQCSSSPSKTPHLPWWILLKILQRKGFSAKSTTRSSWEQGSIRRMATLLLFHPVSFARSQIAPTIPRIRIE